jgi:predicted RNA-binding Zn-ribbon protein involved in translation (DUF1610 family)
MNAPIPAWISNGIVISDSNGHVEYHHRCPYCGYVKDNTTIGIYVAQSRGAIINGATWKCPQCHNISGTKAWR